MKRTIVDANGDVRCPHCGAKNNFVSERSVGKIVAFGVLGAGTRLRCVGCGGHVEPGKPPKKPAPARPPKLAAVNNRKGRGRCAKNGHLVAYKYGTCPIDGSEIL